MPLWRAVRYVLRVRTNVILIIASALGYLFFAGVQTFAVVLMRSRFHLAQSSATSLLVLIGLGGLVGVVFAGRTADRLLSKGRDNRSNRCRSRRLHRRGGSVRARAGEHGAVRLGPLLHTCRRGAGGARSDAQLGAARHHASAPLGSCRGRSHGPVDDRQSGGTVDIRAGIGRAGWPGGQRRGTSDVERERRCACPCVLDHARTTGHSRREPALGKKNLPPAMSLPQPRL